MLELHRHFCNKEPWSFCGSGSSVSAPLLQTICAHTTTGPIPVAVIPIMCIFTTSLGFQLHIMISTQMCSLFIAYKGLNNARQTALKEAACSHFLFSILLFAEQSNMFLQLFWIFQTVNCPQFYFLSEPCNFFVKNSTISPFTCTKTFFPFPSQKTSKIVQKWEVKCKRDTLFLPCSSPAKTRSWSHLLPPPMSSATPMQVQSYVLWLFSIPSAFPCLLLSSSRSCWDFWMLIGWLFNSSCS